MPALFGFLLVSASGGVTAAPQAKYEIRAAAASPEDLRLPDGSSSINVTLQVRVKSLGTFTGTTPACEAAVDFGDGSPIEKVILGKSGGTSNVTDIPHTYRKTGRFIATIASSRSFTACDGRTSTEVLILGTNEQAPRATRRNTERREKGRLTPSDLELFDDVTIESGKTPCPPGWDLIPNSRNGAYRFSCKRQAVSPIVCPGGTGFFDNGDIIGCR